MIEDQTPTVHEVRITFKSGAQIIADVLSFSVQSDVIGSRTRYTWKSPQDTETHRYRRLMTVDPDEIVAVVVA